MTLIVVRKRISTSVNAVLFDLLFNGEITIGNQTLYCTTMAVPQPIKKLDHIEWKFEDKLKVETPGPNSSISSIRQYRDRIEFTVWPWADVILELTP